MVSIWTRAALAILLVASPSAADAGIREQSGTAHGFDWRARSGIVGFDSTATVFGLGNPAYFAPMPAYSGVAALIMDYGADGLFICTGSLLPDRRSIVTAAHCVTSGPTLKRPDATTAFFYGGPNPDTVVPFNPLATAVDVKNYFVHPDYTGLVIDQHDVAILRLVDLAPSFATSYEMDFSPGLTGDRFNVAGYGARSDKGGSVGANLGAGRLRQGDNRIDFRFGDPAFAGLFTADDFFGPIAEYSYVSDFDNGRTPDSFLRSNDASCRVARAFGLAGAKFCNVGVGLMEVAIAGGDSGGPQFIDGRIVSVSSYGLTFGREFGDIDNVLNSSFGEFSGYAPLYVNADYIRSVIPEPGTWAMLVLGFGTVGAAIRRRPAGSRPAAA
jgi:hypothetical protein